MKVSCNTIKFRIDIDFPDADVDMVLREMGARGVQTPVPGYLTNSAKIPVDKNKLPKTPSEASVEFALSWLAGYVNRRTMEMQDSKWDRDYAAGLIEMTSPDGFKYMGAPILKTELEELGITVESWYGLMQGCCHLICEVDASIFSPEIVAKANKIVEKVFKKFVRYYKQRKAA